MSMWQPLDATHVDGMTLLVPYLRTAVDPVRVSVSLKGWRRPDPIVQVQRVGGTTEIVDDMCEVQVDVRHNTYDEAWALTEQVRAAMRIVPNANLFRFSAEVIGPQWFMDEDDLPRIMMEWTLAVRPSEVTP